MAGPGRISVLVSRDLGVLSQAIAQAEPEMRKQIRKYTKPMVGTAWTEAVRAQATTRLEVRVLSDTARVAVSDSNVLLKSATVGKVGKVPASVLARAVEKGDNPDRLIKTKSRKGTPYQRRLGGAFRARNKNGYVFGPASNEVIPRVASLWMQTAIRTFAESVEEAS